MTSGIVHTLNGKLRNISRLAVGRIKIAANIHTPSRCRCLGCARLATLHLAFEGNY